MAIVRPIDSSAEGLDLSTRIVDTHTITGSPQTNEEAIVATLAIPDWSSLVVTQRIYLDGWVAFTVGTSGTAVTLRIRQTNASGTVIVTSGALTGGVAAANLMALGIRGSDATPGVGTYVLTAQVTGGAAASTVSAVQLLAIVV